MMHGQQNVKLRRKLVHVRYWTVWNYYWSYSPDLKCSRTTRLGFCVEVAVFICSVDGSFFMLVFKYCPSSKENIACFMLRKFHIERSASCHHLLVGSAQVVKIKAWTPDIVISPTPIKSLDIKRPSWPPLVQSCFYLEVFITKWPQVELFH